MSPDPFVLDGVAVDTTERRRYYMKSRAPDDVTAAMHDVIEEAEAT